MSSRDTVLRRIRDALGPDVQVPAVARDHAVVSDLSPAQVIDRFAAMVDDYRATVHRAGAAELPAILAGIVHTAGARRVAVPPELPQAWLAAAASADDVEVVRDHGLAADELDRIDLVVTGCAVAIADTGTFVLDASGDQGRRALTLVPDHHVCVVPADRIVGSVPEALGRLDPTRPLTFISGPSATSDIELDRVEGVHGPRTLDVIVVTPDRQVDP